MSHATQLHDRGYLADYMQIMHSSALPGHVDEEVSGHVHARVVSTVKWTLEQALRGYPEIGLGKTSDLVDS
jgi:hypothetical protein